MFREKRVCYGVTPWSSQTRQTMRPKRKPKDKRRNWWGRLRAPVRPQNTHKHKTLGEVLSWAHIFKFIATISVATNLTVIYFFRNPLTTEDVQNFFFGSGEMLKLEEFISAIAGEQPNFMVLVRPFVPLNRPQTSEWVYIFIYFFAIENLFADFFIAFLRSNSSTLRLIFFERNRFLTQEEQLNGDPHF